MSRRPVVVNTDVCPCRVVVRTCSNGMVEGVLHRRVDVEKRSRWIRGKGEKAAARGVLEVRVQVEALLGTPQRIYKESVLPLDHIQYRDDPVYMFHDPYEVHTVFVDSFTKKAGVWSLRVIIERTRNKNGDLWLCTIEDMDAKTSLVTVTAKDLTRDTAELPVMPEALPLQRLQTPEPLNAWERLRRLTSEPQLPDEEPWS